MGGGREKRMRDGFKVQRREEGKDREWSERRRRRRREAPTWATNSCVKMFLIMFELHCCLSNGFLFIHGLIQKKNPKMDTTLCLVSGFID